MKRIASTVVLATVFLAALDAAAAAPGATEPPEDAATIQVHDSADLATALDPRNTGRRIRVFPGDYAITGPLVVPDGALLEGGGVMRITDGLPSGFEPNTESTLRVTSGFEGDVLTLGNGSIVSGLRIIDLVTPPDAAAPRFGNAVTVASRRPGDNVAAEIRDCEIVNPQPTGVSFDGPVGHAVMILTRNPGRDADPPPHQGAALELRMARSIVHVTGDGGALFALNLAARGEISVRLENNWVEGPVTIGGGASRPDPVTEASTSLESRRNLYSRNPGGLDRFGWRVIGGSSAHIPGLASPGASFNVTRVHSVDDRIEGFKVGILAAAGRRWLSASGPVSDNRVELDLDGARIQTEGGDAADFSLQGTLSEDAPGIGREFPAGDRNVLHVSMRGVNASATARTNRYTDVYGPSGQADQGSGNRLEFAGTAADFAGANPGIPVAPPAEFFTDTRQTARIVHYRCIDGCAATIWQ